MRRQEKRRLEKEKKEKAIEQQEPDRKRSKFSDDAPGALHRRPPLGAAAARVRVLGLAAWVRPRVRSLT